MFSCFLLPFPVPHKILPVYPDCRITCLQCFCIYRNHVCKFIRIGNYHRRYHRISFLLNQIHIKFQQQISFSDPASLRCLRRKSFSVQLDGVHAYMNQYLSPAVALQANRMAGRKKGRYLAVCRSIYLSLRRNFTICIAINPASSSESSMPSFSLIMAAAYCPTANSLL